MRPTANSSSTSRRRRQSASGDLEFLPMNDKNFWYYPAHGDKSDDGDDMEQPSPTSGNWGRKDIRSSRWMRKGKIIPWGPSFDEWETEERIRKRVKLMLPERECSPSPVTLPHLRRSPSPPGGTYSPPTMQHATYTSFVTDKAVKHSFRSKLLDELENSTNSLIEGEALMRQALGRLWQVINEEPSTQPDHPDVVTKREDDDSGNAELNRLSRAPDLTPPIYKLFMFSQSNGVAPPFEPSHFASPETQMENLEKATAILRELQDDGREYVERLEEIRETLGEIRWHRNGVWTMVRERAVDELQDVAKGAA